MDIVRTRLSPRQRQILELLAEGCGNKEIGRHLFLSEKTVKNYLRAVFAVYGASNRTQAVVQAIACGDLVLTDDGPTAPTAHDRLRAIEERQVELLERFEELSTKIPTRP